MNFKTRNLKMKMFIVFLILFLSAMLVYRTKMADRDYANVLLENINPSLFNFWVKLLREYMPLS